MRDGDFTTGQYNVLLPDGRKQVSGVGGGGGGGQQESMRTHPLLPLLLSRLTLVSLCLP